MVNYFPEEPWACKCGCGFDKIDEGLVQKLQEARAMAKIPFVITSACRCEEQNKKVGGKEKSAHLRGLAVDIACQRSTDRFLMVQCLMIAGFSRIEVAPRHIHVDMMPEAPQNVLWIGP